MQNIQQHTGAARAGANLDPAEVDRLHKRALDNGATTLMDPEDAFWGARFAMLTDPFGHRWMLNAELPKQG